MRIARVFIWNDDRPEDRDEIRSPEIPHHVTHEGSNFELRAWTVRYPPGQRITDALYDEVTR